MEESSQKELEYEDPDENEGGIRRRLRDRDLLRKRRAEAEQKATNQWVYWMQSRRKRARGEDRGGSGKRGRPKKAETLPGLLAAEEEPGPLPDPQPVALPAVVEPLGVSMTTSVSLLPGRPPETPTPPEPQPAHAPRPPHAPLPPAQGPPKPTPYSSLPMPCPAPDLLPVIVPALAPDSASTSTLAPVLAPAFTLTPASALTSVFTPTSAFTPTLAPDSSSSPALAPSFAITPAPPPAPASPPTSPPASPTAPAFPAFPAPAPSPMETLYTEPPEGDRLAPVLLEELGPDEKQDLAPSPDHPGQGLLEEASIEVPEQNASFSRPTYSSSAPQYEYFPGSNF
ncbi:uncharacterized protein hemgn isoform X3 [Osmerus eperlanus]|uniref:uncharacterized protein hemgn isoform X3 n=1 Tax=Osmerus eperlanus TaxID=29151 RepID=UPI002E161D97